MTLAELIQQTPQPATFPSLTADLKSLGVLPGMTLLVHSSLRSLGWVNGGAAAVILALEAALGAEGTLVMPTHSDDYSDPANWIAPPIPKDWWQVVRETMPAFAPDLTPTWNMGAIPETFRKQNGVLRSGHPQVSFAAWGRDAERMTADHPLAPAFGDGTPLSRIYDLDGYVLLVGVGHDRNTSLHLAEARAKLPNMKRVNIGAPILVDGKRQWMEFEDLDWDESDFPALAEDFARQPGAIKIGKIAQATAQLMSQRALVDFGVAWLEQHRQAKIE